MDAEPTPTRATPACVRLAAVLGRLRELIVGAPRRPAVRRVLVVAGLALAGWLLGTGAGAWAADTPASSGTAHQPRATLGDPVRDQVEQATSLVHAGSDAVGKTKTSLDRHPLAERADAPSHRQSARKHAGRVAELARAGSDELRRSAGSPHRRAHAVSRGSVDHAAKSLVRGTGDRVHGLVDRGAAGEHVRRIAGPVGSLVDSGADRLRRTLPMHETLGAPSSVVDSMADRIRHAGHGLIGRGADQVVEANPGAYRPADGSRADAGMARGDRAAPHTAPHSADSPRSSAATARDGRMASAPTHLNAHPVRAGAEPASGHAGVRHPHAPDGPAPAGSQQGTHGMVPAPVPGGGQPLSGTGDVTWIGTDRIPHRLAVIAPRRGVLPPVVRTAADEPSLSPD